MQEPLTLYKLIVLYMLSKVDFALTKAQIADFLLGKEYAPFLSLQQAINELIEAGFVSAKLVRNRTHLSITEEGRETLSYFPDRSTTASSPISTSILPKTEIRFGMRFPFLQIIPGSALENIRPTLPPRTRVPAWWSLP